MHILNKLFSKVFLITINPPNERVSYISEYFSKIELMYDLRVSINQKFFEVINDGQHEINSSEQSLTSAYSSILYECFYKKLKNIVILEDDNIFVDGFEEKFEIFYKNLPDKWDILHLGNDPDMTDQPNEWIKLESINKYAAKVKLKYATNCTIFNTFDNYKIIADKIVSSRYQIDYVLNDFFQNDSLIGYSPTEPLTRQLSSRQSHNTSEKRFKSLIR